MEPVRRPSSRDESGPDIGEEEYILSLFYQIDYIDLGARRSYKVPGDPPCLWYISNIDNWKYRKH